MCGQAGDHAVVLTADSAVHGGPRVTLLACAACGAGFLANFEAPDYGQEKQIAAGMAIDYYVEQGAGIDSMTAVLLRLGSRPGLRFLEVGCAYGFALDFARSELGWTVEGVDPSPIAALGAAALGVPIVRSVLGRDTPLANPAFDCILASEILEHVEHPLPLLTVLRDRLAPGGVLALTTPNFAAVSSTTPMRSARCCCAPASPR